MWDYFKKKELQKQQLFSSQLFLKTL